MAEYKFQKEVREKAEQYAASLLASGYSARIQEHTFRDYTVKIFVEKADHQIGDVIIYYKPSQSKYTLGTHEIKNKDTILDLERIWYGEVDLSKSFPQNGFRAYVDGSFIDGKIGYGAVILQGSQVLQEFSNGVNDDSESLLLMRQIGGEIQAVYEVLEWALANKVPELEMFFDYEGLELWANGKWKANTPHTAKYQAYMKNHPVNVVWHKVKGHSGDRWNDRADELAQQGVEIKNLPADDLLGELIDQSKSFITFLATKGVEAHFDRIYNEMHSRIIFFGGSGRNAMDIYNTKNAHLEAKWHGFSDLNLMENIKKLWGLFKQNGEYLSKESILPDGLAKDISRYLEIFRPYKGLRFDFIEIATLIGKLVKEQTGMATDLNKLRYNFDLIEKTFNNLNGGTYGKS